MSFLQSISIILLFLPPFCMVTTTHAEDHDENLQIYIVHVRPPPPQHTGTTKEWHESFLLNSSRLRHSFTHALSGFTAELTTSDHDHIRSLEGFLHASVSVTHRLHTTYSPSFLHLNRDPSAFWEKDAKYGEGIIIGVVDSGIDPTHPSFNGANMPKPPSKWKGACNFNGSTFPCNNKIVGGRNFQDGREMPPYDEGGHGTHVAGTAAGRFVPNAGFLESASGTAAGIAPYAHIAAYKVCTGQICDSLAVAEAIDVALCHGVDVISISINGSAIRFDEDYRTIVSYAAVKRGVFITMSAGNDGPRNGSVVNIPPWILTVGASTMDRRIRSVVKLGNGTELVGESVYQPPNITDYLPLIFPRWPEDVNASDCSNVTTLKLVRVEGKIVVCNFTRESATKALTSVKEAGGAAMIFWGPEDRGYDTYVLPFGIPASYVTYADGLTISEYSNSARNAKAMIRFEGTTFGGSSDPAVAAFSSRGPSQVHRGILKPDIIGPGVNVLAATANDKSFTMKSGTSMSCPHLAGVAALLKNSHPDWSPAMIKSAIMTTADVTNSGGHPIIDLYDNKKSSFYAMGAGQVNPVKANNPGLVYDIQPDDYIAYLCGSNYTDDQVGIIAGNYTLSCADYAPIDEANLNYPSITIFLSAANNFTVQIRRTLTNVGSTNTTYTAHVQRAHGIAIEVRPKILQFSSAGQKQSFSVLFGKNTNENTPNRTEGYLIWTSSPGSIKVRSPIMIELA